MPDPELLTESLFCQVYSVQEGRVVLWYASGYNKINADVRLLENGALMAKQTSTGVIYTYTVFAADGTPTDTQFSEVAGENGACLFNGETLSKEEYDKCTATYKEAFEKPAVCDGIITDSKCPPHCGGHFSDALKQ